MTKNSAVSIDTRNVTKMLVGLLVKMENPSPFVNDVLRYVKAVTMMMFRKRPDNAPVRGVSWPKLAKTTLRQKITLEQARRPLIATGAMRESIRVLYKIKTGFVYGSLLRSADGFSFPAAHNVGGSTPGRPPKREWLFLNKEDYGQMLSMAIQYLKDQRAKI